MTEIAPISAPASPASEYQEFISLLGEYAAAKQRIEAIELMLSRRLRELAARNVEAFAKLSQQASDLELRIQALCQAHPEWFARTKSKTLTTPFGKASFRTVNELELVHDDATVIRLLEKESARVEARRQEQARKGEAQEPILEVEAFLRRPEPKLNLEALERLGDDVLGRLGIARTTRQSFALKVAEVDLGELQKAAAKDEGRKA